MIYQESNELTDYTASCSHIWMADEWRVVEFKGRHDDPTLRSLIATGWRCQKCLIRKELE